MNLNFVELLNFSGLTFAVKGLSKNRKGRGFHERSGGEVAKIQVFDKLNSEDNQHEDHVRPQSCEKSS